MSENDITERPKRYEGNEKVVLPAMGETSDYCTGLIIPGVPNPNVSVLTFKMDDKERRQSPAYVAQRYQ
ncbi:hypothetical protein DPMN_186531 [Dreissena polymorpha]|uniref:Uncharacterized protein n=1 Tax=Dreissena polymorpha TaxID=45954 RepID=A0A9D4DQI3_DREPO|nr:hypothetical protein DPMN_186531 [Dreissena polymorpha]